MRVLVVWEPILVTDWKQPGGSALARLPDKRVRQFWDPKHLVSRALSRLAEDRPSSPHPDCCKSKDLYWDEVLLFPSRALWNDAPPPLFWNGPVYRMVSRLPQPLAK